MRRGVRSDDGYGRTTLARMHRGTACVHITAQPGTGDEVRIRDNGNQDVLAARTVKASEPGVTDGDFTARGDNRGVLPTRCALDLGRVRRASFLGTGRRE
ncbi:hypothetical protein [Streptomyces sp. NPDC004680]|uniref:hypothetical protein n=1 Tax=Streptomyces sp. NPDC004680 TaxID=3154287 RepID=UPI0033BD733A